MSIDKDTDKQNNNKPWLWKKGQSGNPKGRPKGKTLKEYVREYLACMTDEEREEFMNGLPKELIWKMAEGNPKQDLEAEVKGELRIDISERIANKHGITPNTEPSS